MSDSDSLLGEMAQGLGSRTVTKQTGDVTSYMAHEDGKLITGTIQDCTPILAEAQELHRTGQVGSSEMRHVAKLPVSLVETYCNQHGITFADWLKDPAHARRMTQDPDLSGFRIWDGKPVH
jgi:hypothetical protein